MTAAALLILVIVILCLPVIARETRRIIVSIASELKAAIDDIAALKNAPASADDDSALSASIADLTAKVDALAALVGTPDELNPPA